VHFEELWPHGFQVRDAGSAGISQFAAADEEGVVRTQRNASRLKDLIWL
jgi:hypothetical protein